MASGGVRKSAMYCGKNDIVFMVLLAAHVAKAKAHGLFKRAFAHEYLAAQQRSKRHFNHKVATVT